MLNLLRSILRLLFGNKHFTGVRPDTRLESEKEADFAHEEREVSAPENPFGNTQITESSYPYENQNYTSSCVPHGVGLGLAIERKADTGLYARLAWIFNYRLRPNFAAAGCYLQAQFDLYKKYGAPLYNSLPTPPTEEQANQITLTQTLYDEAEPYKGLEYWTFKQKFNDIETLATTAQQGHGVPILIFATANEWGRDYPEIQLPKLTVDEAEVRHCVTVLPYSGFMKDGVKYITIQDSAWFGGKKLRHLSEAFVKARVYGGGYWNTVSVIGNGPVPNYVFSKPLRIGDKNEEVRHMQLFLISQGLLPNDCATGLFAGRTLKAVKGFQSRYASEILIPAGLTTPSGFWGTLSMNKANQIISGQPH